MKVTSAIRNEGFSGISEFDGISVDENSWISDSWPKMIHGAGGGISSTETI